MSRPILLDLFCKAGGAGMGYHRAGFRVVGVDHEPQPRYPFAFIQADALEYLAVHGQEHDVVHASPPCQRYSIGTNARGVDRALHPDLLGPTRDALRASGVPYVIENVPGAPMAPGSIELCGLMFSLKVFRHRWFESSVLLFAPAHQGHGRRRIGEGGMVCVAGHGGQSSGFGNRARRVPADHRTKGAWMAAMGIDWMTRDELSQAIPPDYTEYIGRQLMRAGGWAS